MENSTGESQLPASLPIDAVQIDPAGTVTDLLLERLQQTPEKRAIRWFDSTQGTFVSLTWAELQQLAGTFVRKFNSQGIGSGDHVVLLSENRLEWIVADLAMLCIGAVNIPLHSQSTARQVCELVDHCRPRLILVSDDQQLAKLDNIASHNNLFAFATSDTSKSWPAVDEVAAEGPGQ